MRFRTGMLGDCGFGAGLKGSAFRRGRDAERLFWRWCAEHGRLRSVVGHVAMTSGECVVSVVRPSLWFHLTGRAWGFAQTVFSKPRPKPTETMTESATILTMQPLAAESSQRRRSTRAA